MSWLLDDKCSNLWYRQPFTGIRTQRLWFANIDWRAHELYKNYISAFDTLNSCCVKSKGVSDYMGNFGQLWESQYNNNATWSFLVSLDGKPQGKDGAMRRFPSYKCMQSKHLYVCPERGSFLYHHRPHVEETKHKLYLAMDGLKT